MRDTTDPDWQNRKPQTLSQIKVTAGD